jgi:spermidine synthase
VALARVLALDYLGALVGALLFPLVLLPWLGLLPTAGLLALVPLASCVAIAAAFPVGRFWRGSIAVALPLIALAGWGLVPLGDRMEDGLYEDPVVSRLQSRHQRIVLTRRRDDLRLFLDGQLQFSSLDEYRYHEALVHPAMALQGGAKRVLLLGAGDGLALREVLRWPAVQQVDVLELDPAMVKLAREQPFLRRLNGASLEDRRVRLVIGDAFERVRQLRGSYDVIIADFPDPATAPLARLYSVTFYGRLLRRLAPDGMLVTQASTPFFSPKVLASIQATLAELHLTTRPYGVDVPSFGPWGFVLAHRGPPRPGPNVLPFQGRWIDQGQLERLFPLSRDLALPAGERVLPNRLHRPVLADYQRQGRWREN